MNAAYEYENFEKILQIKTMNRWHALDAYSFHFNSFDSNSNP